ncbi:uncharacterized protein LOC129911336 [Episyrphus balteatus]|uniref:uncharacterized protein LOC129911336 n=1 Tax=Episyrphus balteatus TaxID=286459 RepID=UPI0024858FA5|nr:uncharacterized protein LOC129911336 [Episyrphus balteatus]
MDLKAFRDTIPQPPKALDPVAARRARATVTTAGVRRRVLKKHIQQKYLLCGFAIHAFLATPAYLYGNIVETDKEWVIRIWPAIIYQAVIQICRSILEHLTEEYRGRDHETIAYRRVFFIATLIICVSLLICGCLFSSAWLIVTTTTQVIAIVCYGFFAGIGSALFTWKTHVILEAVRPREDKYVCKTIHLCGEAFCQLFLSFVFTSLRTLYGTSQSIVLMAAMFVNLIPISLLITRHREGAISKRISLIKTDARFESFQPLNPLGKLSSHLMADQMDGIDMQQRAWKNPMDSEVHCNYMLTHEDAYVTFLNPHGVEIMEIIPEEDDENISVIRSSSATINNYGRISLNASQNIKCSSVRQSATNLTKIQEFSKNISITVWDSFLQTMVLPLRKAIFMPKLYSTTLLLSTDIFSYVMCLTVLPGLAANLHAIKSAEIPFLFSLLAFPWMCFSLMTPRFGSALTKQKVEWHTLGCICKGLALLFISVSSSKLLLSVSSVLLGFGQAVTMFLQDLVLQISMPRAQWSIIRYPVHFTNGLLILLWGVGAHLVVDNYTFQASVGYSAALYNFSILLWHLIFIFCKE